MKKYNPHKQVTLKNEIVGTSDHFLVKNNGILIGISSNHTHILLVNLRKDFANRTSGIPEEGEEKKEKVKGNVGKEVLVDLRVGEGDYTNHRLLFVGEKENYFCCLSKGKSKIKRVIVWKLEDSCDDIKMVREFKFEEERGIDKMHSIGDDYIAFVKSHALYATCVEWKKESYKEGKVLYNTSHHSEGEDYQVFVEYFKESDLCCILVSGRYEAKLFVVEDFSSRKRLTDVNNHPTQRLMEYQKDYNPRLYDVTRLDDKSKLILIIGSYVLSIQIWDLFSVSLLYETKIGTSIKLNTFSSYFIVSKNNSSEKTSSVSIYNFNQGICQKLESFRVNSSIGFVCSNGDLINVDKNVVSVYYSNKTFRFLFNQVTENVDGSKERETFKELVKKEVVLFEKKIKEVKDELDLFNILNTFNQFEILSKRIDDAFQSILEVEKKNRYENLKFLEEFTKENEAFCKKLVTLTKLESEKRDVMNCKMVNAYIGKLLLSSKRNEGMERMQKKLIAHEKAIVSLFNRLTELESSSKDHSSQIGKLLEILKPSLKVFNEKKEILSNPALKEFYFTLFDVMFKFFKVCIIASTGKFELTKGSIENIVDFSVNGVEVLKDFVVKGAEFIPLAGDFIKAGAEILSFCATGGYKGVKAVKDFVDSKKQSIEYIRLSKMIARITLGDINAPTIDYCKIAELLARELTIHYKDYISILSITLSEKCSEKSFPSKIKGFFGKIVKFVKGKENLEIMGGSAKLAKCMSVLIMKVLRDEVKLSKEKKDHPEINTYNDMKQVILTYFKDYPIKDNKTVLEKTAHIFKKIMRKPEVVSIEKITQKDIKWNLIQIITKTADFHKEEESEKSNSVNTSVNAENLIEIHEVNIHEKTKNYDEQIGKIEFSIVRLENMLKEFDEKLQSKSKWGCFK